MPKKSTPRKAKPSDLKYVGVQKSGLAMSVGKKIADRKKKHAKLLKEL